MCSSKGIHLASLTWQDTVLIYMEETERGQGVVCLSSQSGSGKDSHQDSVEASPWGTPCCPNLWALEGCVARPLPCPSSSGGEGMVGSAQFLETPDFLISQTQVSKNYKPLELPWAGAGWRSGEVEAKTK